MSKGIRVTGAGTAVGPRDECVITVGSEVRRPTAAGALDASAAAVEQMRAVLVEAGIASGSLTTSGVSLNPVYDEYPIVVGFQAAVRLTASTRDIAAAGALLSSLVMAGGDAARVHDVSFRHADPSALVARARDAAWADALARATQLAGLAGRELGEVLGIEEVVGSERPPGPVRVAMATGPGSGHMSLDAGEGSLHVTLVVGFALR